MGELQQATGGGRSGGGDSKTQEGAQEAGALALKRAAEGSGKKGHYNWIKRNHKLLIIKQKLDEDGRISDLSFSL